MRLPRLYRFCPNYLLACYTNSLKWCYGVKGLEAMLYKLLALF